MLDLLSGFSKPKDTPVSAKTPRPKRVKVAPPPAKPVRKAAGAYRTISEVAVELGVATHVLRFWESKFPQIVPLKKSGGRRYYSPEDVALLAMIQSLLYKQGYTIRGVQAYLDKARKKDLKEAVAQTKLTRLDVLRELKLVHDVLKAAGEN